MDKITIGLISRDWMPIAGSTFFAQRGKSEEFGFGQTAVEALISLEKREAERRPSFDDSLAEEIAFLALGAADYLRDIDQPNLDKFGGYMGFISEVIRHAPLLLKKWRAFPEGEFCGVWLYDVTERFGREWAAAVLNDGAENASELLEYVIVDETQKWELCQ